jgi:hypothetical protein
VLSRCAKVVLNVDPPLKFEEIDFDFGEAMIGGCSTGILSMDVCAATGGAIGAMEKTSR